MYLTDMKVSGSPGHPHGAWPRMFLYTCAVGCIAGRREREEVDSVLDTCIATKKLSLWSPGLLCTRILALVAEMHFHLIPHPNPKEELSLFPPHTVPPL